MASSGAAICVKGCGFFGSAATGNMCSKCFRDNQQHAMLAAASPCPYPGAPPEAKNKARAAAGYGCSARAADGDDADHRGGDETAPARRRKVGLTGFRCRCGDTFCGAHRYQAEHGCCFDYMGAGRKQIADKNPVVLADKMIHRI